MKNPALCRARDIYVRDADGSPVESTCTQFDGHMMCEVRYRNATTKDIGAIADIFIAAFEESIRHYTKSLPQKQVFQDLFKACMENEPDSVIVAEIGNRIVGYIIAPKDLGRLIRYFVWRGPLLQMAGRWLMGKYDLPIRAVFLAALNWIGLWKESRKSGIQEDTSARILSIAVSPSHQGMGIGSGLIKSAIARLKNEGIHKVRLEVRPDNASAIHVYEKHGFKTAGRMKDTQGEWLIMFADLS